MRDWNIKAVINYHAGLRYGWQVDLKWPLDLGCHGQGDNKRHITGQCTWLKTSVAASMSYFWLLFQASGFFFLSFVFYFYIRILTFSLFPHIFGGLTSIKTYGIWRPVKENLLQTASVCCWCYNVRPVMRPVLAWSCNLRKRRCWLSDPCLVRQPSQHTQYWNSCSQRGRGRPRNGPEWSGRGCLARVI